MIVDIDKDALIAMVTSTELSYELYDHPVIKTFGRPIRNGRLDGDWMWDSKHRFQYCNEEELIALYELIIGYRINVIKR